MILEISKNFGDIAKVQEYIIALESILFYSQKNCFIDCSKLSEDSNSYDPEYDSSIRRSELNLLYLLDEIISKKMLRDSGVISIINEIENAILSPEFYRDLILSKPTESFVDKTKDLNKKILEYVKYVSREISDKEYMGFVEEFSYLNPSANKASFLKGLEDFTSHLQEKSQELESKVIIK